MYSILLFSVVILFVAVVFLNLYFRIKVMKAYRRLVRDEVQFGPRHILNRQKMKREIFPQYPDHVEDIETFMRYLRFSVRMVSVLTALITLYGAVLMYFR